MAGRTEAMGRPPSITELRRAQERAKSPGRWDAIPLDTPEAAQRERARAVAEDNRRRRLLVKRIKAATFGE